VLSTTLPELGFELELLQLFHQHGDDGISRYVYVISFAFLLCTLRVSEPFWLLFGGIWGWRGLVQRGVVVWWVTTLEHPNVRDCSVTAQR
jgi:hypothetical protein